MGHIVAKWDFAEMQKYIKIIIKKYIIITTYAAYIA
jgi:hypothetical protein